MMGQMSLKTCHRLHALGGCLVTAYHTVVREIVHLIGGLFIGENRLNDPLGKLFLDRTVILLQNLRVMFQSLEQSPQSPHTEERVVSQSSRVY